MVIKVLQQATTILKQSQPTYPSTSSADTSTAISSAIFW